MYKVSGVRKEVITLGARYMSSLSSRKWDDRYMQAHENDDVFRKWNG